MKGHGDPRGAIEAFREERGAAVILALLLSLVVLGIGAVALTARSPSGLTHDVPPAAVAHVSAPRSPGHAGPRVGYDSPTPRDWRSAASP